MAPAHTFREPIAQTLAVIIQHEKLHPTHMSANLVMVKAVEIG
jgi:hypothetical protein